MAQNLGDTESIDALPEGHEYYLRRETTRSWYLLRTMYMCISTVSIGSAVQQVDNNSRGWDITSAKGANLSVPMQVAVRSIPPPTYY